VSARKAQAVLPLARGQDEEQWVARAQTETVRALEAAVRAAGPAETAKEEGWELICVPLSTEDRAKLDQAMALAGKVLGPGAPQWRRLEAICQEYLAAHPVEPSESEREQVLRWPASVAGWLESAMEALEEGTRRWAFLCPVEPVAASMALAEDGDTDPHRLPHHLDDELRRLTAMRDGWDELVGQLGLLVSMLGLWRTMSFASFAHYCAERLGMAARPVEQRAWLERKLYALPALRRAVRDGRVSYEKARLVAAHADDTTVEAFIERAQGLTCIDLKPELEACERAQMCARGELDLRVPRGVGTLLDIAVRAAREASGYWLSPGECLARIAEHFVETWEEALAERSTRQEKVLARDAGFCQVPGCSRAEAHVHHVLYRSRGGADEESNMVSLCAAHHLHGVRRGWVRVRGQVPEGLTWELGVRPGAAPLVEVGVHWQTASGRPQYEERHEIFLPGSRGGRAGRGRPRPFEVASASSAEPVRIAEPGISARRQRWQQVVSQGRGKPTARLAPSGPSGKSVAGRRTEGHTQRQYAVATSVRFSFGSARRLRSARARSFSP
jgi:hypothetical protein